MESSVSFIWSDMNTLPISHGGRIFSVDNHLLFRVPYMGTIKGKMPSTTKKLFGYFSAGEYGCVLDTYTHSNVVVALWRFPNY
jgi:hypothetical protein